MSIRRGEIYWADLDPIKGSEQAGRRPVVIIQNNISNEYARTTIVAPLTTKIFEKSYLTHVFLPQLLSGLKEDSTILLSQIRTVDKTRLEKKAGSIPNEWMEKVNYAIKKSLAL